VAAGIPYLAATSVDDPNDPTHPDWYPAGLVQDDDTLWSLGVPVQQGQVIGYMGDTGIGSDWKDNFNPTTGRVTPRNRAVLRPWDPPQLHFQLYRGRINHAKQSIVDPFGFYAQTCPGEWPPKNVHGYTNPYTPLPGLVRVARATAWVTTRSGQLAYAG